MVSSNSTRNKKEKILQVNKILCRLDDMDFQGSVRLSFKRGAGLMTWVIEEHGNFNNVNRYLAAEEVKKSI